MEYLTKEEILAMEAGVELDRLVATEVMGELMPEFTPENALDLQLAGSPLNSPEGNWLCLCRYDEGDTPTWRPLPYSIDIAAAFLLVAKDGAWDIKKRFRPHPDDPPCSPGRATYQAKVFLSDYDPYEDGLINKRSGRSPWCWGLPKAICQAALLAKYSKRREP